MKRLIFCTVAFLLASGALATRPAAADYHDCDMDCVWWCQSQGFDDGICSMNRPYQCVCLKYW